MRKILMLNLALLGACGGAELVAVETDDKSEQLLSETAISHVQDPTLRCSCRCFDPRMLRICG